MKKRRMLRKILMLTSATLLLVSLTVGVTLAYLTDTDSVTNTFTVGKVEIVLDESQVDEYGNQITDDEGNSERVKANTYKLLPGHKYFKDPVVHVTKESEDCYLYVKVVNQLGDSEMEEGTKIGRVSYHTIANQLIAAGWTQLTNDGTAVENVYYRLHQKSSAADVDTEYVDYAVFNNDRFGVSGTATNEQILALNNKSITVTAYAIQADGFTNEPYDAWLAGGFQ